MEGEAAAVGAQHVPGGFDALLADRLQHRRLTGLLQERRATVVFDAGGQDLWTVLVDAGEVTVRRGRHWRGTHPTTTIYGSASVLEQVVSSSVSGVAAFLDGRLRIRGDLALALQIDGLAEEPASLRFPRSRVADVNGVRTVYLEAGDPQAPPVILLHGLGATNASLLPTLWDLAADYRVIAPDLPGHGATAAPRGAYTPAWFAQWLARFQLAVGAAPAALVGNSLGGRVAVEAALARPEDVTAIALLCPSPAFRRLRQLAPVVRLMRPELAMALPRPTHAMVVEAIRAMLSDPDRLSPSWYASAADEFRRVFRSPRHRAAFVSVLRQIYLEQAHGDTGFWTRLPGLSVPALFIWGERDRLVPAGFARHVELAVPRATSVVIPDCGHVPQFEKPDQAHALIRALLLAPTQTADRTG